MTARFGADNPNYKGRTHRKCAQCSGPINGSGETRKFCTRACQAASYRTADGYKTCPWCAKDFYHRSGVHCSAACARARRASTAANPGLKTARAARVESGLFTGILGRPKVARVPRVCQICSKGFLVVPSNAGTKFCSRACYGKEVGRRQTGEAHPGYKHGLTRERVGERQQLRKHPGYAAWREAVFERDKYKCRACAASGELHAHHHAAWADNAKARLKVSNGVALCSECHRTWHAYDRKGLFAGKESLLQSKIKAQLEEYGFWVFNVPGNPLGMSGVPDLVLCFNGMFGAVECKVFPNYLSEVQRHVGENIKRAGGIFLVAHSEDDVGKVIEAFETRQARGDWVDDVSQLDVLDKELV